MKPDSPVQATSATLDLSAHLHAAARDAARDRSGLRLAALLHERTAELPESISDRLAQARAEALAQLPRAPEPVLHALPIPVHGASGKLPRQSGGAWMGWVLAATLLAGLAGVQQWQQGRTAQEKARLELQVLLGELPPKAYADAAFLSFLKSGKQR